MIHSIWLVASFSIILFGLNSGALAEFGTHSDFYAQKYAQVTSPRGLLRDPLGDAILVLSRSPVSSVIALTETDNGDGSVRVDQKIIVDGTGLNLTHGLTYATNFLYASSPTTVYRWPYPLPTTGPNPRPQIVVHSIPYANEALHVTRSLTFDTPTSTKLYVSIGSHDNIDGNSERARIKRFDVNRIPINGLDWQSAGELFADGLRNSVGLDFDSENILWAVDNGADDLFREDLGGDIHDKNPADELNKLNDPATNLFGYPYCFTAGQPLQGQEVGGQFSWPNFTADGHTDEWCRDVQNNRPPILPLAAHQAPLGLNFYRGEGCNVAPGSFPCSAIGDAFIAYHGSRDSDTKVGYSVSWLTFANGLPKGPEVSILFERDLKCSPCLRPVSVIFSQNGHLIVSSDGSDEIFRMTYKTPPTPIRNSVATPQLHFVGWMILMAGLLWRFF